MNAPLDMSRFTEAKSNRLNADDLISGPRTVTIASVAESGSEEGPVNVHYHGDNGKPFQPCKTMRRVMIAAWGKYASDYVGKSMTLYRDPDVQFGGMKLGGVRISHMSHIDGTLNLVLAESKKKKGIIKILPLAAQSAAPATRSPAASLPADDGGSTSSAGAGAAPFVDDEALAEWTDWAVGMIGAVAKADRQKLARLQQSKAGDLATLETDYPKLHADIMAAIADRNAALDMEGGE